jgi:hypothetical protein
MPYSSHTAQDVEQRGEELYARQIRQHVEAGNTGKFVVIDIETGDYEVDGDDLTATQRLLARRPNAVVYGLRIGHPAAYTLGGHSI